MSQRAEQAPADHSAADSPADEVLAERAGGVQSLARAAAVLRALGEHPGGLTVSRLAQQAELPRSTVHRLVGALVAEDLVAVRPEGRVVLGVALVRLADAARQGLTARIHPLLQDLSRRLDETVDLAIRDRANVTFLDQVVAAHPLRYVSSPGASFPAYCTANGKALLAGLAEEEVRDLLPAHLESLTPNTVTSRERLLAELAEVRRTGVAFDREEHTLGVCAIGAALSAIGASAPPLALSVPIPAVRFAGRERHLAPAVLDTVQRITAEVAGAPPPADALDSGVAHS